MSAFRRRAAGWVWAIAWVIVLKLLADPWRELGGVADERLRWLERVALTVPAPIGFTVARLARDRAAMSGKSFARVARCLALPSALATAATLVVLKLLHADDGIGIVVTAWLSFQAGVDLALGALPLMEGKPLRIEPPELSGSLPRPPGRPPLRRGPGEDRAAPGSSRG
jgi:hypothetical protein